MYICSDCHEIYKNTVNEIKSHISYGTENFSMCPKVGCYGHVFEVDELIAYTIQELNKKGYTTTHCCSGHVYEKNIDIYISFEADKVPYTTPSEFVLEDENYYKEFYKPHSKPQDTTCIRKTYDNNLSEIGKYNQITKTNLELLKWSKELVPFELAKNIFEGDE